MKKITWNEQKNQILQIQRGICFEQILEKIELGEILDRKINPNSNKYPNQEIFIFEIDDYICYVPFVETDTEVFLKTIIFSRKLNKEYKNGHK